MNHPVVLRVTKLATSDAIVGSAEHTWREQNTPNADPNKRHLNQDWRPEVTGSQALLETVNKRLELQTSKPKANRVPCIEYMISAHHDAFKEAGGEVDWEAYFKDAVRWIEKRHGKDNVVAINVQLDERTPHLVVYVVPLVEKPQRTVKRSVIVGRNSDGSHKREVHEISTSKSVSLSASSFMDGSVKLSALQTDFAEAVGQRHGLIRGIRHSQAEHTTVREFYDHLKQDVVKDARFSEQHLEPKPVPGMNRKETQKEVAARLSRAMQRHYAPALSQAKAVPLLKKKVGQFEETLRFKDERFGEFLPALDRLLSVAKQSRIKAELEALANKLSSEIKGHSEGVQDDVPSTSEQVFYEERLRKAVCHYAKVNRMDEADAWVVFHEVMQEQGQAAYLEMVRSWLPVGSVDSVPSSPDQPKPKKANDDVDYSPTFS